MEQRNITDLPFEVLDLIFESCQYLRYKVDLAQVNEKMGDAFAYHCRNEFRRLSPNQRLTTELWVFLIRKCGHSVEELIFDGLGNYWDDVIAQAVLDHCPNLKSLSTCFYRSHQGQVHAFLEKMKDVLISVELEQRQRFSATILEAVESLSLRLCDFSMELPDCPKLRSLDIYFNTSNIEGYHLRFIIKNGKNITTLREKCEPPINADGFLKLLRGCPKLREFYTPMEYIKLYLGYVSTIVEILKDNGVTPENPFKLVICSLIKWKWFRRLLLRVPDANLIDLYVISE
ncbi:uncharacterized protein LOC108099719 [Drosophila ficusphila]|uniref:uncharacterized protein LOC108099719 n=1 Tax=Drosophila ficusphila TaxID=30025 RepID=UPI0007E85111|nr:uncharacterized protein LOC108099719 [Drosophila ficusphila]